MQSCFLIWIDKHKHSETAFELDCEPCLMLTGAAVLRRWLVIVPLGCLLRYPCVDLVSLAVVSKLEHMDVLQASAVSTWNVMSIEITFGRLS